MNFSFFLCLAACRTRSSACDTRSRPCVRCVLCWLAFPLAPALGSTDSAAGRPDLFVGFPATIAGSDFSRSCIIGYGLLTFPMRTTAARVLSLWSTVRSPGSRTKSVCTCQGLPTPGRPGTRVGVPVRIAFRTSKNVGARDEVIFAVQWLGLRAPLSTLRRHPRGGRRMTRGRCGSLLLHRGGLAPPTLCRSPGALESDPGCSLIPGVGFSNSGRGVKLSVNILAGSMVLSAVGACPPHDGVR